ncbi:hypothetical protein NDU88_004071 [Pleurodeles waltl]|uniref:Uncharacterized protein n=1 Tax=Pleurodeles waltl TaxID=8319 RepID=A0AAV7SHQ0_PLEWA|nr:hypothetical protein NDU88_004071 [Pleurodeles waltl]
MLQPLGWAALGRRPGNMPSVCHKQLLDGAPHHLQADRRGRNPTPPVQRHGDLVPIQTSRVCCPLDMMLVPPWRWDLPRRPPRY